MADSSSSSATLDSNPQAAEPENPNPQGKKPESAASSFPPTQSLPPATISVGINPTLHSPLVSTPQPPPSLSYGPPPGTVAVPPTAPSFRPVPLGVHQFSPMPGTGMLNPSYPNPGVQPPGVSSVPAPAPGMASGVTGAVPVPAPQQMMAYQVPPGQVPNPAMRPYATMPNGFAAATPQGAFLPPGVPRFASPFPGMIRTPFPPRPPGAMGMMPGMPRPPVPGIPGVRPIIPPVVRPAILPSVTPAEKPQTTIYIGRIAQSVENDFMLSLLQLCGPVKSWKRAQDPSDGTPRTFGFCEFESAEGVLRALRLLTKLNIDGQELVLKGTQATRDYLKRYVEKKAENSKKLKETQVSETKEDEADIANVAKNETSKPPAEDSKEDRDSGEKEDHDIACSAVLSDEDREADREASEKLTNSLEERLKSRPLPPPPLLTTADVSGNSSAEPSAKLKDGEYDVDILKSDVADDRNDDDSTSDNKQTSEQYDKPETSSPDRSRRYDRRSRERDRERDLKRDKEREIERYERETERERARKDREQRRKIEEIERQYEECLKEWEYREREREKQRQYEKEREKEKERKRKKEIMYDEDDEDDDSRRKWRRGALEEKRKKRSREKEDDSVDRQREEEEIAEAKRKAEEEQLQKQRDPPKLLPGQMMNIDEKIVLPEEPANEIKFLTSEHDSELDSGRENHIGDGFLQNGSGDELNIIPSETRQSEGLPAKRLGFGIVGSGKRTTVPSVFHEEDDEAQKEKKMRPLVPIDYSAEELQAVQPSSTGALPPNLAAAAEFAKRISNVNSKEEKPDSERERGRRPSERSSQRDRDRNDEDTYRSKDENKTTDRDRERDRVLDKVKTPDNKKLLDAKQLIDMIPKTKEELFSYDINWAIYEKHALHERMRPWISKKITEFLGEEETTLVDYIVSSTQEHVKASQMLELLQSILDEEAEMFVLKMWRMLIFEIKKVETGLAFRSKA
ncbi:RNA-binding protein 25-like isoform X1 [Cucurbita pepo subsp. pepo]|uniref:RNA-binding protein 25-like isoform X1 n=2 Tax=Cucurbita pepo subsp. pepo TaxID=3664 RepID=UPI000C9D82A5|nr:RNA-binding protein 25-like isoform X1 [Cucurbita pepo subsp. pepo]